MAQSATIPTTTVTTINSNKPYTVYNLHLKYPVRTTVHPKRYSDFDTLHQELTQEAGSAPPQPLPSKSWFTRTVHNEKLTEDRRHGLETYVKAIVEGGDTRWRKTRAWRAFVGDKTLDSEGSGNGAAAAGGPTSPTSKAVLRGGRDTITSAAQWLEVHRDLKGRLHEARLTLNRRERADNPTAQHEASSAAKQALVRAGTLIALLEDGLERLRSGSGSGHGERLGEGEVRRRKDLLSTARKEREGLEAVLNSLAVASAVKSAVGMGGGADGSDALANQISSEALFTHPNHSTATTTSSTSRRVIGAPLPETERTRELGNEGVLELQRQVMQEQDLDVRDFTKIVKRMREMGVAINEEIVEQNILLGLFEQDVDRLQSKVNVASKRVGKIR